MGFNWAKFASIASSLSTLLLPMINPALTPLASVIGHAIGEAEQIPGATGAQKLQHVQGIVATVAPTIPGVNAAAINESLQDGINTVVAATNVIAPKVTTTTSTVN
jgi:hypothetical protein